MEHPMFQKSEIWKKEILPRRNKKNLNTDILEKIEKSDIFTENCPEIVDDFCEIFS